MKSKTKLLILLAFSILVMVGFAVWHTVQQDKTDSQSDGDIASDVQAMTAATNQADTVPNAENVSSQYHAQVEALKQRLQTVPNDTTHLIRLAQLYQDGHQQDKAILQYEHYLKLHPRNHQAWLDLATCYGNQNEWQHALSTTERLLKTYPDDAFGLYNLGAIHANMGQFKAAREIWTRLTRLENNPHIVAMAKQSLEKLDNMPTTTTPKTN